MPFVGIVFIFISSVLTGTLITAVFRERNSNYVVRFATGFLSLFVFLMLVILVGLKLDFDLNKLALTYLGVISVVSVASLPLLLKEGIRKPVLEIKKDNLPFVLLAAVIGFISYIILAQSFVNDDTLEIVTTAVSTNSVYKYAALTGKEMVNGLPIFNKVYAVPMFYAVFTKLFGVNRFLMILVIIPAVVYITNVLLVAQIADYIPLVNKNRFMIFYLILLVSGTFLPTFGIPVSMGYAILREGYSGYAIIYGILVPIIVLYVLRKKYIVAAINIGFAISLFKIDRVLFALLDFFNSFEMMKSAGKLMALFLISILVMWIISKKEETKADCRLILMPIAFVSYVACIIIDKLPSKKERTVYSLVMVFVFFACVNFQPYAGGKALPAYISELNEVTKCVSELRNECAELKIYASTETMTYARVGSDNTEVLFGRDFDSTYMLGTDYENKSEFISDYDKMIKNIYKGFEYLVLDNTKSDVFDAMIKEGVNAIVISSECNADIVATEMEASGFKYKGVYGKYKVYGRY